jgi:hypothetical protein
MDPDKLEKGLLVEHRQAPGRVFEVDEVAEPMTLVGYVFVRIQGAPVPGRGDLFRVDGHSAFEYPGRYLVRFSSISPCRVGVVLSQVERRDE